MRSSVFTCDSPSPTDVEVLSPDSSSCGHEMACKQPKYALSSGNNLRYRMDTQLRDEILKFSDKKKQLTMTDNADEIAWRSAIKKQLEDELAKRVHDALETPPPPEIHSSPGEIHGSQDCRNHANNHPVTMMDVTDTPHSGGTRKYHNTRSNNKRRQLEQSHLGPGYSSSSGGQRMLSTPHSYVFNDHLSKSNQDAYPGVFGLTMPLSDIHTPATFSKLSARAFTDFASFTIAERHQLFYQYTNAGFREAMRTGRTLDGSTLTLIDGDKYIDRYGIVRNRDGPFWPLDFGPLFPAPEHRCCGEPPGHEALRTNLDEESFEQTVDNQSTAYSTRWRGTHIVFDADRSNKDFEAPHVSGGHAPSLLFESRFECGNLQQARRVGEFEYDLILRTDLYTKRHTQWYYFRVQNAIRGVTYKFTIINLHKRDSLYNHGMKPLLYSEKTARVKNIGWMRVGHHISYQKNTSNLTNPLLHREMNYHTLEWQMEFPNADDTYYMAHCYPYSYTDLKDDLDQLLAQPERAKVMNREVMCETRAGNSCFLITVTNFAESETRQLKKKGIVVTARVHPGESNSSWMMKGLLEYITGSSQMAVDLRDAFVFKIVPMLNPDGVIVGNYRCSLAARDLNRNYRHPRKTSFPTIWHTKALMEEFSQKHEVLVYCDLHGHSRKHNVFMYGCNRKDANEAATEAILKERLFPWLMSQKAPEKFLFRGCKFQIKRGKESTGRVVIFRQLRILNSFTMEATFCGTTICKGENRHFNTRDFQHMGQVFSEVALEYNRLNEDDVRKSEVIVDLTRSVVQQVLEKQGLLPSTLPDLATEAGIAQLKDLAEDGGSVTSPEQVTTSFLQLVSSELERRPSDEEGGATVDHKSHPAFANISQMLSSMSADNMSSCVQLLEDLHMEDTVMESDSSDSDSESDAEMKFVEPQPKRKKKKHKKNKNPKENSRKPKNDRPNTSVLPAIDTGDMNSQKRRHNQETNMRNYVKTFNKSFPTFVSKYRGRSNGGIPCFSQERSRERELKRMEEVRKRLEEEEHRRELQYKTETTDEMLMQNMPTFVHQHRPHISCQQVYHQVTTLPVKLGYMHSESISPFKVVSAGQARTPDDSSEYGDVVDESHVPPTLFRAHPPLLCNAGMMGRTPIHHLLPLQWPPPERGNEPHQKTEAGPSESVSIPLRHSKPGIMVTTATLQADAVAVDLLAAPPSGLNPHRSTVTRGRVFGRPQLLQQQQLQEHSSGPAAVAARLLSTPVLMSREYTHLLMQSVRTHKSNGNVMPLEQPGSRPVKADGQRRHSSYD